MFWLLLFFATVKAQISLSEVLMPCLKTDETSQINYICKFYKTWVPCPESQPTCSFLNPYVLCNNGTVEKLCV